jgi:cytochrome P450
MPKYSRRSQYNFPPGAHRTPIWQVQGFLQFMRDPIAYFQTRYRQFGDIAMFRVFTGDLYILNHPSYVQEMLQQKHKAFGKSESFFELRRLLGNGLLVADGEDWLRQRRLLQPAFHRQRIAGMSQQMVQATQDMMADWQRRSADGQSLNLMTAMMELALDIAARCFFSANLSEAERHQIHTAFTNVQDVTNRRLRRPFNPPTDWPMAENRIFKRDKQVLDRIVNRIIAERRRQGTEGFNDLLAMMMELTDADTGEGMNNRQLRDETMTMMVAGHETSATALSWALYLLSTHPEVAAQLRDEYDRVLDGRPPAPEDLANLPYNKQVVQETLRLYPPAWAMLRQAEQPTQIGGYDVLPGAQMTIPVFLIHRRADLWDEPDRFRPERFAAGSPEPRHKFAYFPFGGGPRLCIGEQFALMEMQLVLPTLLQQYRLHYQGQQALQMQPMVTLRPKNGPWMKLERIGQAEAVGV